ncbi:MAG: hypothetical protein QM487_15665 [Candidatus Marithrix sp.]
MNIVPTAKEMNSSLIYLSNLLCKKKLIAPDSKNRLDRCIAQLKKYNNKAEWEYIIESSNPIKFTPIPDKKLKQIYPQIYLDIKVESSEKNNFYPFKKLDLKIEILDIKGELQSRWHIDLANKKDDVLYQEGPLFHMQGGGHKPQANRKDELKISRPRWAMPPMELILTCEMILANFYPEKWKDIRNDKGWLKLIHIAQLMCYSAYYQQIHDCLFQHQQLIPSSQSKSVLTTLWANKKL